MRSKMLNFLRKGVWQRFTVGFMFIFLSGLFIGNVIAPLTYRTYLSVANGDYLLNVKSVTADTFVSQSENLSFIFCREPLVRIVAYNNIRSFYKTEDGQILPAGDRKLPDGIPYERLLPHECLALSIPPEKRPNEIGVYHFCQEIDFLVSGLEKTASFCTTKYEIIADPDKRTEIQ